MKKQIPDIQLLNKMIHIDIWCPYRKQMDCNSFIDYELFLFWKINQKFALTEQFF